MPNRCSAVFDSSLRHGLDAAVALITKTNEGAAGSQELGDYSLLARLLKQVARPTEQYADDKHKRQELLERKPPAAHDESSHGEPGNQQRPGGQEGQAPEAGAESQGTVQLKVQGPSSRSAQTG